MTTRTIAGDSHFPTAFATTKRTEVVIAEVEAEEQVDVALCSEDDFPTWYDTGDLPARVRSNGKRKHYLRSALERGRWVLVIINRNRAPVAVHYTLSEE